MELLSLDHQRLSEAHISQMKYQEAQHKFLTEEGNYPFTGSVIYEMLEEIKSPNVVYPYSKNHEELTNTFNGDVLQKLEELERLIKSAWEFDVRRTKSTVPLEKRTWSRRES